MWLDRSLGRTSWRVLITLVATLLISSSAIAPASTVRATDSLTIQSYPTIDQESAEVGDQLRGRGGTTLWSPSATSVIYRWYRCPSAGGTASSLPGGCAPITNARGTYYTATESDVGYHLRFAVTGYLGSAASRIWSASLGPVTALVDVMPEFTSVGPLDGEPAVGLYLGLGTINFNAYPATTKRTVSWWRCTGEGGAQDSVSDCVISRTEQTTSKPTSWYVNDYQLTSADVGLFIRAKLTITNPIGSDSIFTPTSEMVTAPSSVMPYFTVEPEITDQPVVGQWVPRTWDYSEGFPAPLTIQYRWYACTIEGDSSEELPEDCLQISTQSYLHPSLATVGKYLRVAVFLSNPTGSVGIYSATSEAVVEPADSSPTISGVTTILTAPVEGTSLSADWAELSSWGYPATSLRDDRRWYSCSGAGAAQETVPVGCTLLRTSYSYTPTASDVGKYLRAAVTYSNARGSTTSVSATSAVVAARPRFAPQETILPTMTGLAMVGQQILGAIGEWNAFPTQVAYTYRWYRCLAAGNSATSLPTGCSLLAGTALGYKVVSGDLNRYLRLAVTATNSIGSRTVWTATSAKVVASALVAPAATGTPCIALGLGGDPYVGASILDTGCTVTFTGNPGIVGTTSSWYRCSASDTARTSGSSMSGCVLVKQNSPRPSSGRCYEDCTPQYTLGQADVGKHMRLAITGTNSRGKATSWSATIGPVVELLAGKLPIVIFPPNLLDAPVVGEPFWQDGGAWVEYGDSDYAPIHQYLVRWYHCASTGDWSTTLPDGCSVAPGTNSTDNYGYQNGGASTYTPVASDVGYFLRAEISARNSVGWTTVYSSASSAVTTPPNEAPTIVSPVLMYVEDSHAYAYVSNNAQWRAFPEVDNPTYQWYRCTGDAGIATDARPANCILISGATSSEYYLSAVDAGSRLRVRAHGENAHGEANSFSATSGVIANPVPRNIGGPAAPRISGGAAVGFPVTASSGTWNGPSDLGFSFSYAWYSCAAGGVDTPASVPGGCTLISGETGATFTPKAAHRGRHIRVAVTANNERGTGVRFSSSLGPVGSGPTSTGAPTVSGSAQVGQQLSATNGTWSGSPTFTYTWWRCTVSGSDTPATPPDTCARINGATTNRYTLTTGERGWFIRVAVTGTAAGVSVTRFSRTTAIVP